MASVAAKIAKEEKISSFKIWLIDNDVEFIEHANGHFQVFNFGNKVMDVWATTEKCRLVTGDSLVGFNVIKKTIQAYRQ